MNISNSLMAYHQNNRYYDIFNAEGLLGKKAHIEKVITLSCAIAEVQHMNLDMEFLRILAEHHDDGRVNQYELLGKFFDGKVSHNSLSIERFNAFLLKQERPQINESVEIMRDVMLYHGRIHLAKLSASSRPYVEVISAADDFENACACVTYLLDEVRTDAKGYVENDPARDQREVSDFVFEHFKAGEKFDKMKYCTTYGEYVLFAAMLATNCIRRYQDIAKVAIMQRDETGKTILERYGEIFRATLKPDLAEKAFTVLSSKVL